MATGHSQCIWELRDSHVFEEPAKCYMFLFPPGNGSNQVPVFLPEACVSTPPGRFILYFAFFKCTKWPQAALMFGSQRSRVGHSDKSSDKFPGTSGSLWHIPKTVPKPGCRSECILQECSVIADF